MIKMMDMKRTYWWLLVVLMLTACHRDQVKISGNISNADEMMLYLDEVDVYENRTLDSLRLNRKEHFRFTVDLKETGFYQLRLSNNQVIVLFPSPGQKIELEADADQIPYSLKITGSKDTEEAAKLIALLYCAKNRIDSIETRITATVSDSLRAQLNVEYREVLDNHRKESMAFILNQSRSFACLYALYQQYEPGFYVFYRSSDLQFFKIVSDSLSKYFPKSKHVLALKANTEKMIGEFNARLIMKKVGSSNINLPEIALPGLTGDTLRLSNYKGRYVLLSFWASADEQSMSESLEMRKVYERFKRRGFEVFQVSFDPSAEAWKRAVRFNELTWVHVIDPKFPNSVVAGNYNVTQIPANYLIDKNQTTILGKNLTPSQLQQKLNVLFN
jgi:peroxiredoxin